MSYHGFGSTTDAFFAPEPEAFCQLSAGKWNASTGVCSSPSGAEEVYIQVKSPCMALSPKSPESQANLHNTAQNWCLAAKGTWSDVASGQTGMCKVPKSSTSQHGGAIAVLPGKVVICRGEDLTVPLATFGSSGGGGALAIAAVALLGGYFLLKKGH